MGVNQLQYNSCPLFILLLCMQQNDYQPMRVGGFKLFLPPMMVVMRSYQGYYTISHQNSEIKRLWAGIVLGWVTSWEVLVLHPLLFFFFFFFFFLFVLLLTKHCPDKKGKERIFFKIKNKTK